MDYKTKMTEEAAENLVSILNSKWEEYEDELGSVDESGFGYTIKNGEIVFSMADGDSFENGLKTLMN